jgi:outer membrane lipoprotein SlyB
MKSLFAALALVVVSASAMAQISNPYMGSTVEGPDARRVQDVRIGVVLDAIPVVIEAPASTQARATGATLGGLLGALAGNKQNWQAQSALGVLGALAGDAVAQKSAAASYDALQLVIQLEGGKVISLVQAMDEPMPLMRGEPVYVVGNAGYYGSQAVRVLRRAIPAPAPTNQAASAP